MKKATTKTGLKIALVAGGMLAIIPAVYGQGIGLQTLDRMTAGTPQQLERGAQVYQDQCATCHGDQGQVATELGQRLGAQGFAEADVERSGLYAIYDVVARGYDYDGGAHPVFENLFFQDQWAVAHYVHNLIDDPQPDPPALVERVRRESIEGVCIPEIRAEIARFAEPESDEQIELGQQVYAQRCSVCHGDEGRGDGPGANTDPPARDFHAPLEEWTVGTSPSALYNVLDQGIEGTGMAAFGHLPDEELWAMVHFMREEFIPAEIQEDMTDEEIDATCRSLSAPPRPEPLPIDRAIEFLAADADEERYLRHRAYGDPIVHSAADVARGQQLYEMSCASCHGASGNPIADLGPCGSFPPFLSFRPHPLEPAAAGGTYAEVAQRVIVGPHATLPDMTPVATFSRQDWQDLQAYLTGLNGGGTAAVHTIDYDRVDVDALAQFEPHVAHRIIDAIADPIAAAQLRDQWESYNAEQLQLENGQPDDQQPELGDSEGSRDPDAIAPEASEQPPEETPDQD